MITSQQDPFRALKKVTIALIIFLFIALGFFVFLMGEVSRRAQESSGGGGGREQNSPARRTAGYSVEEEKEALGMSRQAEKYVREKQWHRLEAFAGGRGSFSPGVRAALLDQWDRHDGPEMLAGLARVLRPIVQQTPEKEVTPLYSRLSRKLSQLTDPKQPADHRSIALKTYAAFPLKLVPNTLYQYYYHEKDERIRGELAELLAPLADASLRDPLLDLFRKSIDPAVCAEIALILDSVFRRNPDPAFDDLKRNNILPKLKSLGDDPKVKQAIEALEK